MKNRTKLGIMLSLMAFSASAFSAPGAIPCSSPDLRSLVSNFADQPAAKKASLPDTGTIVDHATQLLLVTPKPPIQWLGIGWQGPINGILFALTCGGKPIDAGVVGAVEEIKPGPELPGIGNTVLVSTTDASSANTIHRTISLFAIKAGKLTSLWHHTLYEDAYLPASNGEQSEFQVSMLDVNTLDVTGEHRVYRQTPDGSDWEKTPFNVHEIHETYCLDKVQLTYGACTAGVLKAAKH